MPSETGDHLMNMHMTFNWPWPVVRRGRWVRRCGCWAAHRVDTPLVALRPVYLSASEPDTTHGYV